MDILRKLALSLLAALAWWNAFYRKSFLSIPDDEPSPFASSDPALTGCR